MKRTKHIIIFVFLSILIAFPGCARETEWIQKDVQENGNSSSGASAATNSQSAITELTYMAPSWIADTNEKKDDIYGRIERFKSKNLGIEVKLDLLPWEEVITKYPIAFQANESPDIVMINDIAIRSNILNNRFYPLDAYINKKISGDWPEMFKKTIGLDGKIYAYLNGSTDVRVLYYNRNIFKKAGLGTDDHPVTWEELIEFAQKTNRILGDSQYGFGLMGAKTVHTPMFFSILVNQQGSSITDENGNATFGNEACVKAAQFISDLINKYKVTPKAVLSLDDDSLSRSFANGRYAMVFEGSWAYPRFRDFTKMNMDSVGWCEIPRPANGKFATISGFWAQCISSKSRNPDLAFKLLSEFANEEEFKRDVIKNKDVPTRQSWIDLPELQKDPIIKGWTEYSRNHAVASLVAKYPLELYDTLTEALQRIWMGAPVKATLSQASDEYNAKYGSK